MTTLSFGPYKLPAGSIPPGRGIMIRMSGSSDASWRSGESGEWWVETIEEGREFLAQLAEAETGELHHDVAFFGTRGCGGTVRLHDLRSVTEPELTLLNEDGSTAGVYAAGVALAKARESTDYRLSKAGPDGAFLSSLREADNYLRMRA